MHKKYFNFILPIFGAAVVVGSGFSAWVFSDEVSANTKIEGEVVLQPLATLNASLTANVKSFTVDLDQGGIDNAEVDKGITFIYSTETETNKETTANVLPVEITYTLTSSETLLDTDWTAIQDASEYAVTITVPNAVKDYVKVELGTDTLANTELAFVKGADDKTYTATATFNLVATYVSKPSTAAEYGNMKTAVESLAGAKINVAVAATTFKEATAA